MGKWKRESIRPLDTSYPHPEIRAGVGISAQGMTVLQAVESRHDLTEFFNTVSLARARVRARHARATCCKLRCP